MSVNVKSIVMTANAIDEQVYGTLGATNPILANGYGGWSIVTRPQKKAMTNWDGHQPFQLVFEIWFSEVARDKSIEGAIKSLSRMARVDSDLDPNRPPQVRIHGDAFDQTMKNIAWVIQNLEWGKTIRSENHGFRIQQQCTVTLLEHVTGGLVNESNVKPGQHQPKYRTYTIKKGDTLQSIAKKLLGKASRWQEIARLNNIHDPRNLKVGRKIRVPRK